MITDRIDHTNDMTEDGGKWFKPVLPCPKSVKISLDDHCQFKCSFCVNSTQVNNPVMPWEMFTRLIDELVENGTEEIGLFFIGEPLLAKRLEDAIKYVKSKKPDMYVFITTNGHLATDKRMEPLLKAGLNSVKFSYNYADEAQITEVAKVPGRVFWDLVNNIKSLRKLRDAGGYKCGIYASSINFDGLQGEKMKEAVKLIKEDVDQHYWLPQYSFGAQTDFGEQVLGNPGRLANLREALPCWTIFKEGHVTADGSVALCCFDVHDKWKAGSLKDGSFMKAWNSETAQKLRTAHLNKDARGTACESCAHGVARKVIKITKKDASSVEGSGTPASLKASSPSAGLSVRTA